MEKRVLVAGYFARKVGMRQFSEDLAEQLAIQGWQVIHTSEKHGRIPRLLDMLYTTWKQRNQYAVAQIAVFSGLSFIWAEAVGELLYRLKKPFVLTLHGGNLPNFANRWSSRVQRLFQRASSITTPSLYLQEQMQPYRADIQLIPNPIQLDAYPFQHRILPEPNLIWFRAFQKNYRPELAVQTLALVRENFPDATLRMIGLDKGDGSLQATLRLVNALELQTNFTYVGAIPKSAVTENLQQGDILLNTPDIDNTPISVLEAMACGLCVVSTDIGGIPYLLTHEKDALLVPPNNPLAMQEAVERILTDTTLASRISQNARTQVETFSWEIIRQQWDSLLTQVIEQHRE